METVVLRCTTRSIEDYEYGQEYVAKEYTDSEGDLVFEIECTGDVYTVYEDDRGFSYRTWFELVEEDADKIEERKEKTITLQDVMSMLEVTDADVEIWYVGNYEEPVYRNCRDKKLDIPSELMNVKVNNIEAKYGLLVIWLKR